MQYLIDEPIIQTLVKGISLLPLTTLKVVSEGDLSLLPSPESLDEWLDAVLIKFNHYKSEKTLGNTWNLTEYFMEIWVIRHYSYEEPDMDKNTREFTKTICEYLMCCPDILNLSSNRLTFKEVVVEKVYFDNDVDTMFKANGVKATAVNIKYKITTQSN